jgi:hypothetical protein
VALMTDQKIKLIAENILMHSYESVNWTNCYGYTPKKSNSIEFKKALKKALKTANIVDSKVYNYLLENYAQDPTNK